MPPKDTKHSIHSDTQSSIPSPTPTPATPPPSVSLAALELSDFRSTSDPVLPPTSLATSSKAPINQRSASLPSAIAEKKSKKTHSHFNPLHKITGTKHSSHSRSSTPPPSAQTVQTQLQQQQQSHNTSTSSLSSISSTQHMDSHNHHQQPHYVHSHHHTFDHHNIPKPHKKLSTSSELAALDMSKSQSSHSIFKLTRKVTKFANDLALGSTSMYGDEVEDKKFLEFKQKKQREREEKREKEVEHLRKEASEKGIEAYLDHFRFFLKHMDDSDINDPINYALSRRDLWLSWYKRFLTGLRAEIADYENLIKEKERLDRQSIHSASSYKHIKSEADYKLRTKLHDLSSIAPPPIDYVNSSMFQDKRIILILLWYLQILKKLLDQPTLISREILEKLGNSKETVDPSIKPQLQEVTVVTCNKMIGELDTESQSNESIYTEGSIYSANVEFINGWQVRHDNRDLHTNFVSITKKYHRMIDISGKGYLPPELLAENPSFTTPLLDSEFFRFKLNDQQREFLKSYSSFTTPSMDKIPLRSNSQSCVTCADFTLTATEDNLESSLAEFHRIIKPNGFLQLYLWDIDQVHAKSLNHQATDPNEYVRQEIWQRMAKLSKDKNRIIPDITNRIISSLKQQGFKKVKISHVGYPQITTLSEPVESHSQSHSASFSESDPYSTSYQDRINSVLTTNSNKGYKDLRMNSFFEFFSNYMEFLLFTKVLSVFKFTNSMKFKEGTTSTNPESSSPETTFTSRPGSLSSDTSGERKFSVASSVTSDGGTGGSISIPNPRAQTEVVDPEEVNLIKLFIDYKLHGCSGKLVQNQILSSAKVKFTTASTDGVKYEGLCYSMVVVAEK